MRNATHPGIAKKTAVLSVVDKSPKNLLANTSRQLSKHKLTIISEAPISGASQNMVAAGLFSPIFSSFSRRCVRLQRRPLSALALVKRMKPTSSKCASVATIISTPAKMRKITPISRKEKTSNLKAKAKTKTKMSDEDLHMARRASEGVGPIRTRKALTVE